nr:unnamed protein product [Digitaria exilis]
MGGAFSGGAAVGDAPGAVTYPVALNVYDLTPINNYLHWCGLGIFHSAVEDDSHTSSNDNFDDDELEDKHLLPTSSVSEDAIVKEVHR